MASCHDLRDGDVLRQLAVITETQSKILTLLESKVADNSPVHIYPAANETELHKLIKDAKDYRALGAHVEGASLRATIRDFMRLFFKRELAVKFSWSGLGLARKRNKISFQDHAIYPVFANVLHHTTWGAARKSEISKEATVVFCGASDWNGGRSLKKLKDSCMDLSVATSPHSVPDGSSKSTSSSGRTSPLSSDE